MDKDNIIYENKEHNITLTSNTLTVRKGFETVDTSYSTKSISSVYQKDAAGMWVGYVFLFIGLLPFLNNYLYNNTNYKAGQLFLVDTTEYYIYFLLAIVWFIGLSKYRSKVGKKINVYITVPSGDSFSNNDKVNIAQTRKQDVVDEIISNIKKAL